MYRIAIVGNMHWPAVGGAQTYQRLLSQELSKQHEVIILTQHRQNDRRRVIDRTFGQRTFQPYADGKVAVQCIGPGLRERTALLPFTYFYLPIGAQRKQRAKPVFMHYFAQVYRRKLERILSTVDIVHTFNLEYLGSACIEVANVMHLPCIATPLIHPDGWLDDAFSMQMLRRCDFVFANLEYDRQYMIEHNVPREKTEAIGAPVQTQAKGDARAFRHHFGLSTYPLICFIGVKRPYKGYDRLIEATLLVWEAIPQARFVFLGAHTKRSRQILAEVEDPRILDLGSVDSQTKNDALAACDIFCLPSASESFGIVFLEAWRFAKPVIAGDIPSSRELVGGSGGGLTVPLNAQAIGEAIIALLKNPERRQRMATSGYTATQRYTIQYIGQRVQRIYRMLIERASQ